MKLVYLANVIVAGTVGFISLVNPRLAAKVVFSGAYAATDLTKLVGCLWLAIALVSIGGLFRPVTFAPVLLIQFIYKLTFLLVVVIPAAVRHTPYATGMAAFFLIWVVVLPMVIPWRELTGSPG